MKTAITTLWLCSVCMLPSVFGQVQATVRLNNYDSHMPIYWNNMGNRDLAWGDDFYVEILGATVGSAFSPIANTETGATVFKLSEPGYFDGGVGVVNGAAAGGAISLQVRAWRAAASYDAAGPQRGVSLYWIQFSGSWDQASGLPATGPAINIPSTVLIGTPIPEPSSVTLGVVGAATLLTNRVVKNLKSKATATNAAPKAATTSAGAKPPAGTNAVALPK